MCLLQIVFVDTKRKRETPLLSVPLSEALALPTPVEQTTSEPKPIWYSVPLRDPINQHTTPQMWGKIRAYKVSTGWYNHTRVIYRCYVQDRILKLARFQRVSNLALSKRLQYVLDYISPPNTRFVLPCLIVTQPYSARRGLPQGMPAKERVLTWLLPLRPW